MENIYCFAEADDFRLSEMLSFKKEYCGLLMKGYRPHAWLVECD